MARKSTVISVVITGEADKLRRAFGETATESERFEKVVEQSSGGVVSSLKRIGETAAGFISAQVFQRAAGAVKDFFGGATSEAADLQQSIGGVESVFGAAADAVFAFGETAANVAGLSKNQVNELATATGAFLKNFGFDQQAAADQTLVLTQRAADMAAMFGGPVEDAMSAIQAGLRGQADPLERYGVSLTAARVEAHALAMTGKSLAKELTDEEKMLARIDLIMQQTADSAGQFAREQDTAAGAAAVSEARYKNLQAELGTKLLPITTKLTQAKIAFVGVLSSKVLPVVEKLAAFLGETLAPVWEEVTRGFTAFVEAFKAGDGDVTSSGFPGFMERVAAVARRVFDWIKANVPPVLREVGRVIRDDVIPFLQALATFIAEKVMPIVVQVGQTVGTFLVDTFKNVWEQIKENVLPALEDLWASFEENILPTLETVATFIAENVLPVLADIGLWIQEKVLPIVGELVGFILGDLIPAFFKIVGFITEKVIPTIANWATRFWEVVTDVKNAMTDAKNWIGDRIDDVVGWFRGMGTRVKDVLSGITDTIKAPFKAAFNAIAEFWNSTVGKLSFKAPGWIPGIGGKGWDVPDIPTLAQGGIALARPGGILANIAEGGRDEAVIPLPRDWRTRGIGGGGGGDTYVVQIHGDVYGEADFIRKLENGLSTLKRKGSPALRGIGA